MTFFISDFSPLQRAKVQNNCQNWDFQNFGITGFYLENLFLLGRGYASLALYLQVENLLNNPDKENPCLSKDLS